MTITILWAIANSSWGIAASASMLLNIVFLYGWTRDFCRSEQRLYEQQRTITKLERISEIGNRLVVAQDIQLRVMKTTLIELNPNYASRAGLIKNGISEGWIRSTIVPFARKSG
jgi:hypothetical protein